MTTIDFQGLAAKAAKRRRPKASLYRNAALARGFATNTRAADVVDGAEALPHGVVTTKDLIRDVRDRFGVRLTRTRLADLERAGVVARAPFRLCVGRGRPSLTWNRDEAVAALGPRLNFSVPSDLLRRERNAHEDGSRRTHLDEA